MKYLSNILGLILLILFALSCKKIEEHKEQKLTGTWKQEIPLAYEPVSKETWSFTDDKKVIRQIYSLDTTIIDTGGFYVNSTANRNYLVIENLDYNLNGTYIMLKQTKEMLLLQRIKAEYEAAFLRKEFTKE